MAIKNTKQKENKHNIREIFSSSSGYLSSKRIIGSIILLACMVCVGVLVFREGGTDTVRSLIECLVWVAAGLLGVSNITAIWKNPQNNNDNSKKNA